jgi:hypothetical protein
MTAMAYNREHGALSAHVDQHGGFLVSSAPSPITGLAYIGAEK